MKQTLKSFYTCPISYEDPISVFEDFANQPYAVLLTGKGEEDISRFSFIGIYPQAILSYEKKRVYYQNKLTDLSVWEAFRKFLYMLDFSALPYPLNRCGIYGFLSYTMRETLETLRRTTRDSYEIPDLLAVLYREYYLFDHDKKLAFHMVLSYEEEAVSIESISHTDDFFTTGKLNPECTPKEYAEKVEKIRDYIFSGDVYEVNLSQQINGSFTGNPYLLFKKIFQTNSAPYSSFLTTPKFSILCNSPESFLRAEGKKVETRPIKGTAPRGKTLEEDEAASHFLFNSDKNQAELYMIIDLLRNDLGKVCQFGTVKVKQAKRLEKFQNVWHLVGIVEGLLEENLDYVDLIRAAFPGGSITGCPKIRCMEIIDELETYTRNLYTGSLFWMNPNFMESNIVIRTAVITDEKIFLNAGGAVTIDSDPVDEFEETEHKLQHWIRLLSHS